MDTFPRGKQTGAISMTIKTLQGKKWELSFMETRALAILVNNNFNLTKGARELHTSEETFSELVGKVVNKLPENFFKYTDSRILGMPRVRRLRDTDSLIYKHACRINSSFVAINEELKKELEDD